MTLQSVMNGNGADQAQRASDMKTYQGYDVLTNAEGQKTLAEPKGYLWLRSTLVSAQKDFATRLEQDPGTCSWNPITWVTSAFSAVYAIFASMLGTILGCFGCPGDDADKPATPKTENK